MDLTAAEYLRRNGFDPDAKPEDRVGYLEALAGHQANQIDRLTADRAELRRRAEKAEDQLRANAYVARLRENA